MGAEIKTTVNRFLPLLFTMSTIGNLIWLIFGGVIAGLFWSLAGLFMILTVIGIPYARACFVIAKFSFLPFGRELIKRDELSGQADIGTGTLGTIGNLIWILLFGWWLALLHLLAAASTALTIIGIPFALQHLKLAAVCFAPVGRTVVKKHLAEAARIQNAQAQLKHIRGESSAAPSTRTTESPIVSPPPQLSPAKFTVARGEQVVGEFTQTEIQAHLSSGLLVQSDWLWNPQSNEWQPIRSVI